MSDVKISLLLPSRGRPQQLKRMSQSAFYMAARPWDVEVIVRLDADDPCLEEYAKVRGLRVLAGQRGEGNLSMMWNECYEHALGEIVMHAGDDIVFLTRGWDRDVRDAFAAVPDRILFAHGDDLGQDPNDLGTHGFLHRRWVETVGYFVPPLFSCDWNDVWLTDVADMIGRRKILPIVTEHLHYAFDKGEFDQTHQERQERGVRDQTKQLYLRTKKERQRDAMRLRRAIQAAA